MQHSVIIIGAGLTGLTLAYRLKREGIPFKILEARDRIGGRIETKYSAGHTPIDMGATWLGKKHEHLFNLLNELDISTFRQFAKGKTLFEPISVAPPQEFDIPESEEPSYRIAGGTQTLIDTLAGKLSEGEILLNEKVTSIRRTNSTCNVQTVEGEFEASTVVTTLPPRLLVNRISFRPALPQEIQTIAGNTHIWMGDAIKFGLSYEKPFWRENGYSGTAFSNVGPATELYDHANIDNSKFALKGFLQPHMYRESAECRIEQVLEQLVKFFGPQAENYLSYEEKLWRDESETYVESSDFILPHANNGHEAYRQSFWNGDLHIEGSETSEEYGGYMEGAIISANETFKKLVS